MISKNTPNRILSDPISLIFKLGFFLFFTASVLTLLVFFPIIKEEMRFALRDTEKYQVVSNHTKQNQNNYIIPVNMDFSVIIPKISANSPVIENVNPFDENEYRDRLKHGLAHAKGSALPNELGNTFIFAHSSDSFYNAGKYNAVFYLIRKLEKGEDFYIAYKREIYKYKMVEKLLVNPGEVNYMYPKADNNYVTLMTCWPPGTDFKRLLVVGIRVE